MAHTLGPTPLVLVDAKTWRKVRAIEPASKVLAPWLYGKVRWRRYESKVRTAEDVARYSLTAKEIVTPAMRARYGG